MNKVLRFVSLPFERKKLLVQCLFLVWLVRISLWVFSFKHLNKWRRHFDSDIKDERAANWDEIEAVSNSVRSCSRYVPRASCLTQAFAVGILLRLRGQNSQLKIGVNKDADKNFTAHAWIEINGRIIIGKLPRQQHFSVLNSSNSIVL